MTHNETERAEAREALLKWLAPGDTVHNILRHVSRSGMQRVIQPVKLWHDPDSGRVRAIYIGWNVARLLGARYDRQREGVVVGGCGMDMGFHLVYSLSHALWPEGFGCIGEGCPSNDHTNGDRDYTKHEQPTRAGQAAHWHRDGGYALRQRWI